MPPQTSAAEEDPGNVGVDVLVTARQVVMSQEWQMYEYEEQIRDLEEILNETSDEKSDRAIGDAPEAFAPDISRLIFGSPTSSTGLRLLKPRPVEDFTLWQAYLDSIDPLIKLFHAPTV
ncbi:uncharacterized protein M421DRAFT_406534 [Didymella exigua CBS 183.55]|uniref:Uncharacterized protein n=1 Tax=Didymella exigua CBS 183.55 TaxID=1150837 RepID=A0A6A5R8X4_9PLEO|nr:uncharacterized protein M421DRAFT_406534 [Didymella exigua CBS 183.55]KAF1923434.1 hypothetical protein M421DRAFT_406534 [Didymella exigua CBS 183.55]